MQVRGLWSRGCASDDTSDRERDTGRIQIANRTIYWIVG